MKSLLLALIYLISVPLFALDLDCGEYRGVKLPCWTDYLRKNEGVESLPYFPYAKRPNGCSVLNFPPGYSDSFQILGEQFNFNESCNAHDKCYYTLNSSAKTCNKMFLNKMLNECSRGSDIAKKLCNIRAKSFYDGVISSSLIVHAYSQSLVKDYLARVLYYVQTEGVE